MLSYEEVIEFAEKHYAEGGDSYVETFDKALYDILVKEFDVVFTEEYLLDDFRQSKEIMEDRLGW